MEEGFTHPQWLNAVVPVAHVRGIIWLVCTQKHVPIVTYAPSRMKKAIVDHGGASKQQIQRMVTHVLHLKPSRYADDVSDALALAMTAARSSQTMFATSQKSLDEVCWKTVSR